MHFTLFSYVHPQELMGCDKKTFLRKQTKGATRRYLAVGGLLETFRMYMLSAAYAYNVLNSLNVQTRYQWSSDAALYSKIIAGGND